MINLLQAAVDEHRDQPADAPRPPRNRTLRELAADTAVEILGPVLAAPIMTPDAWDAPLPGQAVAIANYRVPEGYITFRAAADPAGGLWFGVLGNDSHLREIRTLADLGAWYVEGGIRIRPADDDGAGE